MTVKKSVKGGVWRLRLRRLFGGFFDYVRDHLPSIFRHSQGKPKASDHNDPRLPVCAPDSVVNAPQSDIYNSQVDTRFNYPVGIQSRDLMGVDYIQSVVRNQIRFR